MYLVCRPCSSSPFPSTSCLYPGLITTMISTDFWRNTFHHWSEFSACRRQTGPWSEVYTSLRNLSIHLVVSNIRAVLSKMSICNETLTQRLCELLLGNKFHGAMTQLTAGSNPWSVRNFTKWIISLAVSMEYVMKTLPVKQMQCIRP